MLIGWNVSSPTTSSTVAVAIPRAASRSNSSPVKCRPAVGAAADPGVRGEHGLVPIGITETLGDVGRQWHLTVTVQQHDRVVVTDEFHPERVAGRGPLAHPHERQLVRLQDLADGELAAGTYERFPRAPVGVPGSSSSTSAAPPVARRSRRRAGITRVSFSTSRSPSRRSSGRSLHQTVLRGPRSRDRRATWPRRGVRSASARSDRPATRSRSRRSARRQVTTVAWAGATREPISRRASPVRRRGGASPRCSYAASSTTRPARRTGNHPLRDQERLVDVLDRLWLFADADRNRRQADRTAVELCAERREDRSVDLVEPAVVDTEQGESLACDGGVDRCRRGAPRRSHAHVAADDSRCEACHGIDARSPRRRRGRCARRGCLRRARRSPAARRPRSSRAGRRARTGRATDR